MAPPAVPYLGYPMPYMYPYPPILVPPPPPTPLKKKRIETETVVEKDLLTMNTMIDNAQRDARGCVKTAILEENWEEKHKLLLEEFIRQEEENKYNLEGQEKQILDSFLNSKKCKIKNFKKPVSLPPSPQEKGEAADQPFFTIFSLLLTLIIHNCFDISIVSYGILALLGYYIRSLHTPAFAFDYRLLLETPPTEWLKMKDTVFSSHKSSLPLTDKVTHEPETLESHKKIKTDILTKYDLYFHAGTEKFLISGPRKRKRQPVITLKHFVGSRD